MKKKLLGVAAFTLILTGCQKSEVVEDLNTGKNQFQFAVYQGKSSKASELTNDALHTGNKSFPLYAYQGDQNAVKTSYFDETLTYGVPLGGKWNTTIPRFLTDLAKLQFYAFYPQAGTTNYTPNLAADEYPSFEYAIQGAGKTTDLIAAKVNDNEGTAVILPFKHILSQINFGVKGYYGAKIKISDISINQVFKEGKFTYTFTNGVWTAQKTKENYAYSFAGTATDFITPGATGSAGNWSDANTEGDNVYVFGDGGNWAAGKETGAENVWYVTGANNATVQGSAIVENTPKLSNALMLLPQPLATGLTDATVTFKYSIQDLGGAYVVGSAGTPADGEFDLNMDLAASTEYANTWLPNLRYLYIIDFTDYLDGKKLSFTVDVDTNPWENYDGENGDGTVDVGSIGLANLIPTVNGTVNLTGSLINSVTANFSGKFGSPFVKDNTYTLNFKKVQFSGKSVSIVFNPKEVSATYEGAPYTSGTAIATAAGNGNLVFTRL